MKQRWILLCAVLFALNCCYAQMLPPEFGPVRKKPAYKPRSIPAGPNADSTTNHMKAYIAWRADNYIKDYKKHGSTNPKWDDKVKAFYKDYAMLIWDPPKEISDGYLIKTYKKKKNFFQVVHLNPINFMLIKKIKNCVRFPQENALCNHRGEDDFRRVAR